MRPIDARGPQADMEITGEPALNKPHIATPSHHGFSPGTTRPSTTGDGTWYRAPQSSDAPDLTRAPFEA